MAVLATLPVHGIESIVTTTPTPNPEDKGQDRPSRPDPGPGGHIRASSRDQWHNSFPLQSRPPGKPATLAIGLQRAKERVRSLVGFPRTQRARDRPPHIGERPEAGVRHSGRKVALAGEHGRLSGHAVGGMSGCWSAPELRVR
jgi:hypothetical protein